MSRFRVVLMMAWLLLTGSGCMSDSGGVEAVVVRDSAGITIVENSSPGWEAGHRWRLSGEPSLTIGAVDGDDPAYQFSMIAGITRLSDGRIAVLDYASRNLRYFDAEGKHALTVGRAGQGPGEFRSPQGLLRINGDTIVVDDPARPRRRLFFGADGAFIREEAFDFERFRAMGPWAECQSPLLSDGSVLQCKPEDPGGGRVSPGPGHLRRFKRLVRVTWSLDSIAPLGLDGGIEQWGIRVGDRMQFLIHPFHARSVAAAGRDPLRIALVTNPEYSIEIWRPNGELEQIIRRLPILRSPTEAERSYVRENAAAWAGDIASRAIAEISEPEFVPAAISMLFDKSGNLWVARHQVDWTQQRDWDIFDSQGHYLGGFTFPENFMPQEIGEDYVLGAVRSDLDVPFVQVWGLYK